MSSDDDRAPARTDDDNRYKAVQAKLLAFARAMDDANIELAGLRRRMQMNAKRTEDLARDIANADLDLRFVEMTNLVAVALGGAAVQVRKLDGTAHETLDLIHNTRKKHQMYEGLDELRSNRRERTPKPGFFER